MAGIYITFILMKGFMTFPLIHTNIRYSSVCDTPNSSKIHYETLSLTLFPTFTVDKPGTLP